MVEARKTALFALAAFLWSFVGLLAGAVFAISLGIEGRPVVFFAAVGVAVGWFGFSGSTISIARLGRQPRPAQGPDEARAWLDDFLVKQQRK